MQVSSKGRRSRCIEILLLFLAFQYNFTNMHSPRSFCQHWEPGIAQLSISYTSNRFQFLPAILISLMTEHSASISNKTLFISPKISLPLKGYWSRNICSIQRSFNHQIQSKNFRPQTVTLEEMSFPHGFQSRPILIFGQNPLALSS